MDTETYLRLKGKVRSAGFSKEIIWAEKVEPCEQSFDFWMEYSWVVVSSGIKNQVARVIWGRVLKAMTDGIPVSKVYGHKGKAAAIQDMWCWQNETFSGYRRAKDKLSFLESLPWIGKITKFHLAKNLGIPVCKPDRHLVRIAAGYGMKPFEMCGKLAVETGDKIAVVDTVIWRAANLGMV